MNPRNFIPALPESAPFTPEQRAYLNGFLAGMFSRVPATATPAPTGQAKPATPLTIVFGSQTGTAETLAKRIAKEAGKRGLVPTIHDLASYPVAQLAAERALLVITSTYGDGEPPDNARGEQIARFDVIDRSLTLMMLDGYTYAEISASLGLTESNVGVKLNRIKKRLTEKSNEDTNHGF